MKPFTNIAQAVDQQANLHPEKIAIYFPEKRVRGRFVYSQYTFLELKEMSDQFARGLLKYGFKPGDRVALMVTPSLEFFALTFALFKARLVPILIDPGIGLKNLKQCLSEASPIGFIGVPKAQIARVLFGWAKNSIKKVIRVGGCFLPGTSIQKIKDLGLDKKVELPQTKLDDLAAMIFTSGSTGVPKGVVYRHQNFLAQIEFLNQKYDMKAGDVDLPTFPLFALFNPAFGMTSVIPHMDFTKPGFVNPEYIIEPIKEFNIANMFGSPALLARVGRYAYENKIKLPSLKRILSAGAPANPKTLKLFKDILNPSAQVFTPYGATEALPVSSIGSKKILEKAEKQTAEGKGVCVGELFKGVEVKIIKITDEPIANWSDDFILPVNTPGEVVVKGSNVTKEYFNRKEANLLGKIQDGDSFWHRMGDIGYFDQEGDLWFLGRKAHRVELENRVLFSVGIEGIFNAHPSVYRTALVGIEQGPVLCVELEKEKQNEHEQVLEELKAMAQNSDETKEIKHFFIHPSFPVDIRHNAKIFREKLRPWAKERLS